MKMSVGAYIDRYITRMAPYNSRFLFVTSVADYEEILVELDRRTKSNRWSKYKGRFSPEGGLCVSVGGGLTLICASYLPNLTYNCMMSHKFLYVMSHEIQHCLLHLAKRVGFNPLNENEPHTYMTNWMLERLFSFMQDYHQVVFSPVPVNDNVNMSRLRKAGAIDALNLVPATHVRDALAREARALINNDVKVSPFGTARSVTYFEQ